MALATSLAVLDVTEIAAQVPPSAAEPFEFPALEHPTYLPWIKVCWQHEGKKVCSTRSDGRLQNGATTVSVELYEQEGGSEKFLRITLPHNVMIGPGSRVVIDAGEPMRGAYVVCVARGCEADYTATDEMIGKMMNGRYLIVQAIHVAGQTINWMVPISDLGKAYEGPSVDLAKFWSIYDRHPKLWKDSPLQPWKDDTLQPHLRPRTN